MTSLTDLDKRGVSLEESLGAFEAGILVNPWRESTWKKIRGSLTTAARVYPKITPENHSGMIICDPEELMRLVAPYKRAKSFPVNCGFKNYESFYTWQSNVKRFFEHVSGQRQSRCAINSKKDAGARLLKVIGIGVDGQPLLTGSETIPIASFIGLCREADIDVNKATPDWVRNQIAISTAGRASTIRQAAARIDKLSDSGKVPRDVLPPCRFGDLSDVFYAGQWRTPEVHPEFAEARDRYIKNLCEGTKRARLGLEDFAISTHGRIGEKRAKSIRQAINWFHHGLVVAGLVRENRPFPWRQVAVPSLLLEIADLDAAGAIQRSTQGETRGTRIKIVINFLDTIFQGYKSEIGPGFFDYDILNNPENFETDKAKWKRDIALKFVESPELQRIFYGMPERFFSEAVDLIDRWDKIGPAAGKGRLSALQGRGLDLAILAVKTMITTRFPLRLDSVIQLTAFGKTPHLIQSGDPRNPIRVDIPGYIVKNGKLFSGVPLLPSRTLDPSAVLKWYLEKVHHLVLEHKVRGANRSRHLLFAGLTREPMARKYKRYTAEAGLGLDAHMVRHLAGSILYARGIPVEVIAELLGISEQTVIKNYIYINRSRLRQKAIDEVATIYRELEL
ncbi:hypothetical protein BMG03_12795 [Thioclava nitratireducens]|uniref:Tyr recombinase domain-containing protein n=1 Tax=Thioclava nitratireducens TaxID=1915078 RepID=A0ABN4XBF6_9RHOB|nr:tyrosine-type recombinase/integrase [Thioclava nitratireducens]AQS48572.1 hypothetical protein BMG03_12795 [Thioclava nitratireducens]